MGTRTSINQELSIVTDQLNPAKFVSETARIARLVKYGVLTPEQAETETAKFAPSEESVQALQTMTGKIVRGYFAQEGKETVNRSLHATLQSALVSDSSDENLFHTLVSFEEESARIKEENASKAKAAK
jgi:hypothetical protein